MADNDLRSVVLSADLASTFNLGRFFLFPLLPLLENPISLTRVAPSNGRPLIFPTCELDDVDEEESSPDIRRNTECVLTLGGTLLCYLL